MLQFLAVPARQFLSCIMEFCSCPIYLRPHSHTKIKLSNGFPRRNMKTIIERETEKNSALRSLGSISVASCITFVLMS